MCIFKVKEIKNDFIISVILSMIFLFIIYYFNLNFIFYNIYDNLGVIITIGITMTGFLITSLTILLIFPENNRIRFIKKHSTYKHIFYTFILSIMLFVIMSILGFILKVLMPFRSSYFLPPLIFIFIWSIMTLFRCIWLLKRMIDIYFHKPGEEK